MRLYHISSIAFIVWTLLIFTSCRDKEGLENFNSEENEITCISVSIAGRGDTESGNEDTDTEEEDPTEGNDPEYEEIVDLDNYEIDDLIPYEIGFDSNSVIFVSQMTTDVPAFQTEDVTYAYSFIPDTDADWDRGYNFHPGYHDDPLEWFKIGNGGTYHGGFALYALYFPLSDTLRQTTGEDGTITYSVMSDQSTIDNLKKSDILGAYHSTATLFSRLRFRMFHLMTYVRVRLYLPVYREDLHTGFKEDAIDHATLDNVTPEFAVEWSANRSSDTQGPAIAPLDGENSIIMYTHEKTDEEKSRLYKINYKKLLPDKYHDQGIDEDFDYVRIYDFSVLIPMQKGTVDEDGEQSSFANTEFLNFFIRSNSGAINRYYFSQAFSANTSDSNLEMNQGNFQYIQLIVPRVGNKVVYIGSKVNRWNENSSHLVLKEEK